MIPVARMIAALPAVRPIAVLPDRRGTFALIESARTSGGEVRFEPLASGIADFDLAQLLAASPVLFKAARRAFLALRRLPGFLAVNCPPDLAGELGLSAGELLKACAAADASEPRIPPDATAEVRVEIPVEIEGSAR